MVYGYKALNEIQYENKKYTIWLISFSRILWIFDGKKVELPEWFRHGSCTFIYVFLTLNSRY